MGTAIIVALDHVQVAAPPGCEAQARAFYGELLGLEEVPKPPGLAGQGGAWFAVGAAQLHIGVEPGFSPARKAHPALRVDPPALQRLAAALAQAGHPVVWDEAIAGVRRFFSSDPWGNRLEFVSAAG
jgi:catechol 2,3-dioxygenase-like lactoylglutathione lyase family enzyme